VVEGRGFVGGRGWRVEDREKQATAKALTRRTQRKAQRARRETRKGAKVAEGTCWTLLLFFKLGMTGSLAQVKLGGPPT
jgi:hypothetical protein